MYFGLKTRITVCKVSYLKDGYISHNLKALQQDMKLVKYVDRRGCLTDVTTGSSFWLNVSVRARHCTRRSLHLSVSFQII
jgi:hypothetical protein